MYRYLYLHGFASGGASRKGVLLRRALAPRGVELELLELNVPSFETQTYSAILRHMDDIDRLTPAGTQLRLIGSSMGGYLAARWAELSPRRVDRLFLLCPGFHLEGRWPLLLGAAAFRRWKDAGHLDVDDGTGRVRPLHWRFVEDTRRHPAWPDVHCPTRIVHGTRDDVVPIDYSRRYVSGRPGVTLVEVDDDHRLLGSIDRILHEIGDFFGIAP